MSSTIHNPVLPGFNPDPSILRVGGDFYVATSTFEWFPGIQVFHSRDLANWTLVNRPIGERHVDLIGNPSSGGLWAPCLSWDGELFHLIYTDVKHWDNYGPYKDQLNYLTTAPSIEGPWSDPVYLNGSGFDGSLFHDDDGRKWFLNMEWDHRLAGDKRFSGILIQEYDPAARSLVGPVEKIFPGSELGRTEAPHLYKKDAWYYLITAEGGTGYEHAVTVARSRTLMGPYVLPDHHPLLTAWNTDGAVQKSGHGSLVDDEFGNWYLAHLSGRPIPATDRCVLGRETSIQEIEWLDAWPRLRGGGNQPRQEFSVPWDVKQQPRTEVLDDFQESRLPTDFQTLRAPFDPEVYRVGGGVLTMRGQESIMSRHHQSLVARRQEDFRFEAETELSFDTDSFQRMAGLSYRYDEYNQYYLHVTYDEVRRSRVVALKGICNRTTTYYESGRPVGDGRIRLKVVVDCREARFFMAEETNDWETVGPAVDASVLSDDYVDPLGFTGAFIGMACQDLRNRSSIATFHYFRYTPLE